MSNVGSIASIEGGNYIESSDIQSKWAAVKDHATAIHASHTQARAQGQDQTAVTPATQQAAKAVAMPEGKSTGVCSGNSQGNSSSNGQAAKGQTGSADNASAVQTAARQLQAMQKKSSNDDSTNSSDDSELNSVRDKVSRGDDLSSSELALLKEKDPALYSKVMQSMLAKTFESQNKHVQEVLAGAHFSAEA